MVIAITGATGFLGSHCAANAFRRGHSVRLIVRNVKKTNTAMSMHGLNSRDFEIVEADLEDPEALGKSIADVDYLIHAAAVFSLSPLDAQTMMRVNPTSTRALLSAAATHNLKKTVYVSTMGVFAPIDGGDIDENTETSTGLGPYTKSKIESEKIAREFQVNGLPLNIVYPGGIFGPIDPNPELSDSMGMLAEILKRNVGLTAKAAKLAMVDVRDVAEVCVGALTSETRSNRYHVWGELVTMNEVLDLVREITGRDVKFFSSPLVLLDALGFIGELITIMTRIRLPLARESMKMFTQNARVGGPGIVNQNAIRDQFGYPKFTLKESLSDSLSWLYENGHLNAKQSGKLANI